MTDGDVIALASDFPAATEEQWRALVEGVLKGAPFERLVSRSADGLAIAPLHRRRADAQPLTGRAAPGPWRVLTRIEHPDPAAANAQARHDLANGATGLSLVCAGAVGAYGFGLPATQDAIAATLDGIALDAATIEVALPPNVWAKELAGVAALCGPHAWLGLDPIGASAASGLALPGDPPAAFAAAIQAIATKNFTGRAMAADGRVIHDAGGTEAQELAFVLACGVAYLRPVETGGISLDYARRLLFFRLAADADQILTLAKHRALRKLWARIEDACGLAPEPIVISAHTAWRMTSARGSHVNMLRATVAVFAAATGGADAITVLPHTIASGLPERTARRLARNTQLLLMAESGLDRVLDPASGSGAIERITDDLAAAAWRIFQSIEAAGGAWTLAADGDFARAVAAARAARESAVAQHRDVLTGLSEFADLDEARDAVLAPFAASPSAATAFTPMRLAAPYEKLREASDRILQQTGARPHIFLATLGALADFGPRATFARNLFEAGGIAASTPGGSAESPETNIAALASAFAASGASVACICASDDTLARDGVAAADALKRAGARWIAVAGRPRDDEAALRAAGVDAFAHLGCDAVAILEAASTAASRSAS